MDGSAIGCTGSCTVDCSGSGPGGSSLCRTWGAPDHDSASIAIFRRLRSPCSSSFRYRFSCRAFRQEASVGICTGEHIHIAIVWPWPNAEPAQTEWLLKSLSDCDALLCLHSICSSSEVAALMQRLHGRKVKSLVWCMM